MHFQQHLKRAREIRGWLQARMAQELGTTPNTISVWERGLSLPSPYFREKLYELLGKNALELGLLEEDDYSDEAMVEQQHDEEQKILEEAHFTSSRARSVQLPPEAATDSAFIQNKVQEADSYPIKSAPLAPQKVFARSRCSPGKLLLVVTICISLLGALAGTLLLILAIVLDTGFSQAYHPGSTQKNRIAVVADGTRLTLYINGQRLVTVSDAAYMHGQIGGLAGSEQQTPAEAAFSNSRVWAW